MDLSSLPVEDLMGICENLSLNELSQLARTSGHISQVCQTIIEDKQDELANQVIDELLGLSPTREDFKNVVFPIMRAQLLPVIKKLIRSPANYLDNSDLVSIFDILNPTVLELREFFIGGKRILFTTEVLKIMKKYKLLTSSLILHYFL